MESNQFDQLTRRLAGALSRRTAVSAALGGTMGALFIAGGSDAKKKKKKKKKGKGNQPAECVSNQSDGTTTSTMTFGQKGFYLDTVSTTPLDPREPHTTSMTVRQNQTVLMDVKTSVAPDGGPLTVRVTYGKVYQGTSEALFTVQGGMVSGTIDGRAIVPFAATTAPSAIQFQDGQDAPAGKVDQKLLNGITSLLSAASASPPTCTAGGRQDSKKARTRAGDELKCLGCKGQCVSADAGCGWGAAAACSALLATPFIGGALYGACIGPATATCVKTFVDCMQNCRLSTDCCPIQCGKLFDLSCCEADETCLTWGTGLGVCCPPGDVPCHEKNCCKPGTTCMPDGSCCPNQAACGNGTCCTGFSNCCGNQCCAGVCNGNTCCNPGTTPCGSGCCDGSCCGGSCCPTGRICCGSTCCASGYDCQGGTCVQKCPSGQLPCHGLCCTDGKQCYQCPNGTYSCRTSPCVN